MVIFFLMPPPLEPTKRQFPKAWDGEFNLQPHTFGVVKFKIR